ncbi:Protein C3orf33-like protein [Frankliniella fusca]|uniref:Protein C3orf33-like protein n=1 Tax=Frankliniella fusca TaxID=407009 RepID=A0AAE1LAF1_9NEOP|nr:Protein C3orf33-like protein [Frankliniella fusca]
MAAINDLSVVMDENKRGIQYGLYSAALFGLAVALRSVRPFKKFSTPQSVPSSFVKKHVTLHGRVMEVEPSGELKVDHFPIWPLPGQSSSLLSVQIDSIQTVGLSTAWLSTVVKGSKIKFQPIAVNDNALSCIRKNVGLQLVSLGFASVKPIHTSLKSKLYLKYYKELLAAEDKAEKKKLGIWNDKD